MNMGRRFNEEVLYIAFSVLETCTKQPYPLKCLESPTWRGEYYTITVKTLAQRSVITTWHGRSAILYNANLSSLQPKSALSA